MSRSQSSKRRTPARPHAPAALASFGRRLASLRAVLRSDAATAGDQAIKLLEEYLEYLSLQSGYDTRDSGSLGRYVSWLRGQQLLTESQLDQIETYTQVRNCLAHTYGLQTSPQLAGELLDFLSSLLRVRGTQASELMAGPVRTINAEARLLQARDIMLSEGYSRLPVLDGDLILGLLTERDVVLAEAAAEQHDGRLGDLLVRAALAPDAAERIGFCHPRTALEELTEQLRDPRVAALLVTSDGRPHGRLLGIITHADLLSRIS